MTSTVCNRIPFVSRKHSYWPRSLFDTAGSTSGSGIASCCPTFLHAIEPTDWALRRSSGRIQLYWRRLPAVAITTSSGTPFRPAGVMDIRHIGRWLGFVWTLTANTLYSWMLKWTWCPLKFNIDCNRPLQVPKAKPLNDCISFFTKERCLWIEIPF